MTRLTFIFKAKKIANSKLLLKKYLYLTPKQEKKDY